MALDNTVDKRDHIQITIVNAIDGTGRQRNHLVGSGESNGVGNADDAQFGLFGHDRLPVRPMRKELQVEWLSVRRHRGVDLAHLIAPPPPQPVGGTGTQ